MGRLKNYLPVVSWALFILYLTMMPGEDVPSINIPHLDKIAHFGLFSVLAYFFLFGLRRDNYPLKNRQITVLVLLLCIAYGGLIEVLQYATGWRSFEVMDIFFDAIGAIFGILAFYRIEYFKNIT